MKLEALVPMKPMVGALPASCARAANGSATAAPPSRVMNWRRLMCSTHKPTITLPHRRKRAPLCITAKFAADLQLWVIFHRGGGLCRADHFRFAPKADVNSL